MEGRDSLSLSFAFFAIFMLSVFSLTVAPLILIILFYHDIHARKHYSQVYASITCISVDSR